MACYGKKRKIKNVWNKRVYTLRPKLKASKKKDWQVTKSYDQAFLSIGNTDERQFRLPHGEWFG